MMEFEPYFADDTDGVHFQVCVDGIDVLAHVGRQVLARRYGADLQKCDCVALFVAHRAELMSAAVRHVRAQGPETVILRLAELMNAAAR